MKAANTPAPIMEPKPMREASNVPSRRAKAGEAFGLSPELLDENVNVYR